MMKQIKFVLNRCSRGFVGAPSRFTRHQVQQLTDERVAEIDKVAKAKQEELMALV